MRHTLSFFLNGQLQRVGGREALGMLAPFLRYEKGLTGTKTACAEGACGSCSVLLGRPRPNANDGFDYAPINACIYPVYACDGSHIITVEGLNGPDLVAGQDTGALGAVQSAMVDCHGAQCGFCTPGVVVALTAFHQGARGPITRDAVQSALEGNLCRCTGYAPIIDAGVSVERAQVRALGEIYPPQPLREALDVAAGDDVDIIVAQSDNQGAQRLFAPADFAAALGWKAAYPAAVVTAGHTELGVTMNLQGDAPPAILSLARVRGLDEVEVENGALVLGARATWAQVALVAEQSVPELAKLLRRWASPQLRNVGTVAGNLVKASPISDSLPFLLVCEATIELESASGARQVSVADFLGGGPNLRADELVRRVVVPLPLEGETLRIFKVAKRRAFARSIVSAAFVLKQREGTIESLKVAVGGAAPGAIRLPQTETFLRGQPLAPATWREAGERAQSEIAPYSDYEAGSEYRRQLVANLFRKFGATL